MGKMYKVKITVIQRAVFPELAKRYLTDFESFDKCSCMEDNQEFIAGGFMDCPEGFCAEAWQNIWPNVLAISRGGTYAPYVNRENMWIACCTDGLRPVTFLLERGEEM